MSVALIACTGNEYQDDQTFQPLGDEDEVVADGDTTPPPDGDKEDGDVTEGESEEAVEQEEEFEDYRTVDLANPFIGTGGVGFGIGSGTPGAAAPFGMVLAAPDTRTATGSGAHFYHCSGYYDGDDIIKGFSQVHLYGTGANDLGNIMFMPSLNEPLDENSRQHKYRQKFKKEDEDAKPGFYSVKLENQIVAEMTATERTAFHRYTYPENTTTGYVVADMANAVVATEVRTSSLTIDSANQEVSGWAKVHGGFTNRYGGLKVYFSAKFNKAFTVNKSVATYVLSDDVTVEDLNADEDDESQVGAYLGFDVADGSKVEMIVGISYVSVANAKENRETEIPEFAFDSVRAATEQMWEDETNVVRFWGGSDKEREVMGTALYHAFLMPDIFSDVNGDYLGFDSQVHKADDFVYYTNFSMWDTYRTLHPLLSLVKPERQRDMVRSLLKMAEHGGTIPKWPMGAGYTGCMISTPGDSVIADAYVKGIRDFDAEFALTEMVESGSTRVDHGRGGIEDYVEHGLVYADSTGGSAAKTLEHAVNDYSISRMALAMGETAIAEQFELQSKNYKNIWDPETQFLRGKNSDGSWYLTDGLAFDEWIWQDYYTEGNAWQYLWLVPQDVQGLFDLFPSEAAALTKLETFFDEAKFEFDNLDAITKMAPPSYYWHGNEPDLQAAYMFLYLDRPDLTQKWVTWVQESLYGTGPDGIAGNDDCGTLSAWYIFSSLGFYPLAGSDLYWVGKPMFKRAEVKTAGGMLVIEAPKVSETNIYVQSVTLNGQVLSEPWFTHDMIVDGGSLVFDMGPEPGEWGKLQAAE